MYFVSLLWKKQLWWSLGETMVWKWLQIKCTGQNGSLLFPYHPRNLLRMYIDPSNKILLLTKLLCSFLSLEHISLPSSSCTAVSLLSPTLGEGWSPKTVFHIWIVEPDSPVSSWHFKAALTQRTLLSSWHTCDLRPLGAHACLGTYLSTPVWLAFPDASFSKLTFEQAALDFLVNHFQLLI